MRAVLVFGALVACGGPERGSGPPTWSDHVAPIVEERCVTCHQDGQIAPFALDTYDDAAAWGGLLADAAEARLMPPFLADAGGACQTFEDAAWLDPEEIDTLRAWADAGAPEGGRWAPLTAPPAAHLDQPDVVVDLGVDYSPAIAPDDYRCFVVDPALPADRFLTAFEVVPGDPRIVHHVILYTLDSAGAEAAAESLDAMDATPGYTCFGSSVVAESRPVAAWAPGTPATRLPEGSGIRLAGGRKVVIQVHYNTASATGTDRTAVRLELEEAVPSEALVFLLADLQMELPPGQSEVVHTFDLDLNTLGLPLGVYVRGVFPHMHTRGRSMRLEALREQGTECLADVPRWDFDWQRMYWYTRPVYLYPTDVLRLTCSYDTSDDAEPVVWGEGTGDEMCLFGLVVTL